MIHALQINNYIIRLQWWQLIGYIDDSWLVTLMTADWLYSLLQLHKDDTLYMEAYEKMLETWMDLVTNMKDLPVEVLYPQAQEVFNTYVQCHISAPEGTRTQVG